MAFDVLNVGTTVNDGTGESLRSGGVKINSNFAKAVEGPASATNNRLAVFDGTTGKLLKNGAKAEADLVVGPASATDNSVAVFDGTTGKLLKDGAGTVTAGKFAPTANTVTGNGMYLPAANTVAFSTNGAERVRIDSAGNVGIGTTSPSTTLDVGGTAALKMPVGTNTERPTPATGMLRFNTDSGGFEGYDGSAWGAIGGGGGGGVAVDDANNILANQVFG